LRKLNAPKEKVYKKLNENLEELEQDRTVKINEGREGPLELEEGDLVHERRIKEIS